MNETPTIPPLVEHLFRVECPACGHKWLRSHWNGFFYPLHYAAEHLGISPWRRI